MILKKSGKIGQITQNPEKILVIFFSPFFTTHLVPLQSPPLYGKRCCQGFCLTDIEMKVSRGGAFHRKSTSHRTTPGHWGPTPEEVLDEVYMWVARGSIGMPPPPPPLPSLMAVSSSYRLPHPSSGRWVVGRALMQRMGPPPHPPIPGVGELKYGTDARALGIPGGSPPSTRLLGRLKSTHRTDFVVKCAKAEEGVGLPHGHINLIRYSQ